jgi:hypothetical protein
MSSPTLGRSFTGTRVPSKRISSANISSIHPISLPLNHENLPINTSTSSRAIVFFETLSQTTESSSNGSRRSSAAASSKLRSQDHLASPTLRNPPILFTSSSWPFLWLGTPERDAHCRRCFVKTSRDRAISSRMQTAGAADANDNTDQRHWLTGYFRDEMKPYDSTRRSKPCSPRPPSVRPNTFW